MSFLDYIYNKAFIPVDASAPQTEGMYEVVIREKSIGLFGITIGSYGLAKLFTVQPGKVLELQNGTATIYATSFDDVQRTVTIQYYLVPKTDDKGKVYSAGAEFWVTAILSILGLATILFTVVSVKKAIEKPVVNLFLIAVSLIAIFYVWKNFKKI